MGSGELRAEHRVPQAQRPGGREFEDIYWGRWFYPINVLALCLAAVPFAFGSCAAAAYGKRVFLGIVFALGFYVLQMTFSKLAGRLPLRLPHRLCDAADDHAAGVVPAVQATLGLTRRLPRFGSRHQPRAAGAVVPGQAVAVDPRPPESQAAGSSDSVATA
jgi:hypothetical protein